MSRSELWKALEAIGGSGSFCHSGVVAWEPPGLEVEGVGPIALPLGVQQAGQLIEVGRRAPYGKGAQTVVDLDVRRVWQIEPAQLTFSNPQWSGTVEAMVNRVKEEFDIHQAVQADLYKFLLYEAGGFFVPHRDTEKTRGMFATLVVCLPSSHQGGDLWVEHEERVEVVQFAEYSASHLQFAAFYADCRHEVKPVEKGCRACLVYNLSLRGRTQRLAPRLDPLLEPVTAALRQTLDERELPKLVIPLSHEYSREGLGEDYLKGQDRGRYHLLLKAAARLDWVAHLCHLLWYQEGGAEESYDRWDRGPRRYTMGDVVKESATLSGWLDERGQAQDLPNLRVKKAEFLGKVRLDQLPAKKSIHEATGNEGVTVKLRYRTAVVVLWPRHGLRRVLTDQGQKLALARLWTTLETGAATSDAREWAGEIMTAWRFPRVRYGYGYGPRGSQSSLMLRCLARLGDPALGQRFVAEILPRDYDGSEGQPLVEMAEALGWPCLQPGLATFFASQGTRFGSLGARLAILEALATGSGTEDRRRICREAMPQLERALAVYDNEPWPDLDRTQTIGQLLESLAAFQAEESLERVASHMISHPQLYGLHKVVIPYLLGRPTPSLGQRLLHQHCVQALREATREEVVFPSDWAIQAQIGCTCQPCLEAQQFLRSPDQRVHLYRAREDLRNHLKNKLERYDLEFSVIQGRPAHTLRCEKNHASYCRRQRQYEEDQALLADLLFQT